MADGEAKVSPKEKPAVVIVEPPETDKSKTMDARERGRISRITTQSSMAHMSHVARKSLIESGQEERRSTEGSDVHAEYEEWEKKHEVGDPPPTSHTWTRYLDNGFAPHQEFQVSKAEGLRLASLGYRMYKYIQKETAQGRIPIMNPFKKSAAGPRMGVPVGGFGSGTINRGWRGDWGRNYLFQGFPNYNIVDINAFSVSTSFKEDGSDGIGSVMTFGKPDNNKDLSKTWKYGLSGSKSYYQGLYPRAWTTYEEPDPNIKLVCRQMSPVIPHNYKESSYPVGTFQWTVANYGSVDKYVNIMFSFLNGTGDPVDSAGRHFNHYFEKEADSGGKVHGIYMRHQVRPNER